MNSHVFKIKINADVKGFMWYASKGGEIFEAKNWLKECFILTDDRHLVWKTDCEIVE